MGTHYVPQFYLKGFVIPDSHNQIITYECDSEKSFVSNIKNIGQETKFYPAGTEKY